MRYFIDSGTGTGMQQIPHIAGGGGGLCNVSLYKHWQDADPEVFRPFLQGTGAEFAKPDLVPYPDHF
jgi:hypothetical protein